jgi:hypothetical protein
MEISFHHSSSNRLGFPLESVMPVGGFTTLPTILVSPPRLPATGMNAFGYT